MKESLLPILSFLASISTEFQHAAFVEIYLTVFK